MKKISFIFVLSSLIAIVGCDSSGEPPKSPSFVNLTVGSSTSANVIAEMGREPDRYSWTTTEFTKDDLPTGFYCMTYSDDGKSDLIFVIDNRSSGHVLDEVRIEGDGTGFSCLSGSLRIGTTLEDAVAALGAPASTIIGEANAWAENVLYKDIEGVIGKHYYANSAHGIRMFFGLNAATAVYIYSGTEKVARD